MRNEKPFWKEPSLKHVWARATPGAKMMCKGFILVVLIIALGKCFGHMVSLYFSLGSFLGMIGILFHDLQQYVED